MFRHLIIDGSSLLRTVIKVQRHEEKLKNGLGLGKLTRKVLRLLRADAKFPMSSDEQEKSTHVAVPANIYHNSHREIENTLLNAEWEKAQVLTELQRRLLIQ